MLMSYTLVRKFTWSTPENSIHEHGLITTGVNIQSPVDLDIAFRKLY